MLIDQQMEITKMSEYKTTMTLNKQKALLEAIVLTLDGVTKQLADLQSTVDSMENSMER